MSSVPTFGSPPPSDLLGVLRSWLHGRSSENWAASGDIAPDANAPCDNVYGSARVLVVDDDPFNLLVMKEMLKSLGLVPWLAADGAEAVALACGLHFDLILMDLQMPILDGLEATSAIRRFEAQSSRSAVPVLAYSSTAVGADALAARGVSGRLIKPCEVHELEDCLVRWCPTYRPAPAARAMAHVQSSLNSASRESGTNAASRR